jgi:hypothetical protein
MKASEIFYVHDIRCERGFRHHTLEFFVGGIRDLASESELQRNGGVGELKDWFDKYQTAKQVCLEGKSIEIRFQQSMDENIWSECYAARVQCCELSDVHCKLLAKLVKVFDCVDGFDLSLHRAIGFLQGAGARQVFLHRNGRKVAAIVSPGAEGFVRSEFDDVPIDTVPEKHREKYSQISSSCV